jgi:hypothetical protein
VIFPVLLSFFYKFDNKLLCRNGYLIDSVVVLHFTVVQRVTKYFGVGIGCNLEFIISVLL